MKWSAALGVLAGLLLPVPLVLLLSEVLYPGLHPRGPEEARVSPVLGIEERMRRVTYQRSCQHSSECEAPLGCLADARLRRHYCTDSKCMTDLQCPEGQVCGTVTTVGGGPLVRMCIPLGVRQEGESCVNLPDDRGAACVPGLLCSGSEGWCARPCRKGESPGCPEGFFCADVKPQPVCLPTCETRGCPEGQQCVRYKDGVSTCAVVYGPHCQQSPCPEGRKCDLTDDPRHPGKVWLECVEECGEGLPPCTPGLVCDGWHCLPPCDPQGPGTCGEGYRCAQSRPNRPWTCQPLW
jgi:hypothetical protein